MNRSDVSAARIPAGRMPVDVPLPELRVGHQVLAGGRLAVAEGTVRVHRPRTA
ncbi:hypothetical protein [Streptomyces vinaceus]|uniref:hypothetical protein n=1 Tax=Streptomyces vinaceus TaxID=1960 RepID=UPI0036C002A8